MSEFSRPVGFERPPAEARVEANEAERAALATRFGIPAVERLACRFRLRPEGRTVRADGELEARVVQSCVVSLEPVPQDVAERFSVVFVPAGTETEDDDPEAPDEITVEGSAMDLGEAAAEQLALALDPYPRLADAAIEGLEDAEPASPFAALRRG